MIHNRMLHMIDSGDPLILAGSTVVHMVSVVGSTRVKVIHDLETIVVDVTDLTIPSSKLPVIMEKIKLEDETSARAELLKFLLDGAETRKLANEAAKLKYAKPQAEV